MGMKLLALALAALAPCIAASPDIEKGKISGNPNAPIKLEIFSDFQCPSCKALHDQVLPQLIKDYVIPGKVCIVAREFPLPMHPYSREAAAYAVAASRLGIYQPVADRLFETQPVWSASGKVWDSLSPILSAEQKKKIQAGAKEPAVIAAVQQDVELGQRERVGSTPTVIYTKGTKKFPIPWPVKYSFLQSLLDGK
jgi:protein-disulfide isomerase